MMQRTPPVVKYIVIINVIMFLLFAFTEQMMDSRIMLRYFALFYFRSELFMPHQLITHMFMHGGPFHILFNMLIVWMFGKLLEGIWGSPRFLVFYTVTGLGAALVHMLVMHIQVLHADPATVIQIASTPVIGASGAVFGLLMAFGMTFPNARLMLLFPPMPIRGKYIAVFALVFGVLMDFRGNVAHFAHLGGMIFAFILMKIWGTKRHDLF
jgi:rhomboid-like protein